MTVLSNNTFDMFFSSPWRMKWRKCVCPSLGLRMRTQPYHPSIQARKKWNESKKTKEGGADEEGRKPSFSSSSPPPRSFSRPIFHWSLTLVPRSLLRNSRNRTETLAILFTSRLRAAHCPYLG